MSDTTQNNAMAEITLALAMGFFSIMVLTMVSMGSGITQITPPSLTKNGAELGQTPQSAEDKNASAMEKVDPDNLVIFFEGKYLDASLKPISLTDLSNRSDLILGLDPLMPMNEALKARQKVTTDGVTVVPLSDQWLKRLEEMIP